MLKEPSKIPEPMPESLAAIKNVKVSSRTIQKKNLYSLTLESNRYSVFWILRLELGISKQYIVYIFVTF